MTIEQTADRPALRISGLTVRYGAIQALHEVSLDIPAGKITALIGLNGAGKTSLLRAIVGQVRPSRGEILARDGANLLARPGHRRAAEFGLAYVPEGRGLFARMTVRANLEFGLDVARHRAKRTAAEAMTVDGLLEVFPGLRNRLDAVAGNLSGGEQQMVSIGRALLASGDILLLDEPSIGLAPVVVHEIFNRLMDHVATRGITVLLVEQKTDIALAVADFAHILESGVIQLSGTAQEIAHNPDVMNLYFGQVTA
jgi:branched-chain amino acid transport system ATP-binding protein